jgi:hypothetical protein
MWRTATIVLTAGAALTAAWLVLSSRPDSEVPEAQGPVARVAAEEQEPTAIAVPRTFPHLEPATPAEARAVVEFSRSAEPGDLAELRRAALTAKSALTVGNAVRALGRLRAFHHDAELLKLLDDPRLRVRQEAVRALGSSGDASVVDLLEAVLRDTDTDGSVRHVAIDALGRLPGPRPRALLARLEATTSSDEVEHAFVRAALRRGAEPDAPSEH